MEASIAQRRVRTLGLDAGGTMTDTILVDDAGGFVIGKAQTTPHDEAVGFSHSIVDAAGYWELQPDQVVPEVVSGVYSGTSMINRLLERKGQRVGLLVTRGMEDGLRLELGLQTWLGMSFADTLHVVTHRHHEPLVPRKHIRGIGGRIANDGAAAIPLYEDDVAPAVEELLDAGVDCICVNLVYSWRNPTHEARVGELAREVVKARGADVPVFLASELCPRRGDFARLNTLVIEAYAAEPSRVQLESVRQRTRDLGARFDLRVMASFGGTISIDADQLVETLVSGPIGGCVGARYLGETTGLRNIACADIGGTSFDVALIVDGKSEIRVDPDIAHFKLNIPMVRIDSVGAGTGTFVRVNPVSRRLDFGPDSAGARIGTSNPEGGVDTVTITDCDVVLGWINPDYFLGGAVQLDRERAVEALRTQVADPLGLSVEDAALGVIELFEAELTRQLQAAVMGQGFEPADFALLGYGGGGPLHVAGFSSGLHFADVLVPTWAAAFSAFGCVCAPYSYRFDRQVDMNVPLDGDAEEQRAFTDTLNEAWRSLRTRIADEFAKSGIAESQIDLSPSVRMQYQGQLNDIEVRLPMHELRGPDDIARLVEEFERLYGNMYASAAKSPELGYSVTLAILGGTVPIEKPTLPEEAEVADPDPSAAQKGVRQVITPAGPLEARLYEMDELRAGMDVVGPAVIEAPSTTFAVPAGRHALLDSNRIFHLRRSE